jgi:hypothetical protein
MFGRHSVNHCFPWELLSYVQSIHWVCNFTSLEKYQESDITVCNYCTDEKMVRPQQSSSAVFSYSTRWRSYSTEVRYPVFHQLFSVTLVSFSGFWVSLTNFTGLVSAFAFFLALLFVFSFSTILLFFFYLYLLRFIIQWVVIFIVYVKSKMSFLFLSFSFKIQWMHDHVEYIFIPTIKFLPSLMWHWLPHTLLIRLTVEICKSCEACKYYIALKSFM